MRLPFTKRPELRRGEGWCLSVGIVLFAGLFFLPVGGLLGDLVFAQIVVMGFFIFILDTPHFLQSIYNRLWLPDQIQYVFGQMLFMVLMWGFYAGVALGTSQAVWFWLRPRVRAVMWDLLAVISLLGLCAPFLLYFYRGGWQGIPSGEGMVLFYSYAAVMLTYYIVIGCIYGHFGGILFARRKTPPQPEATA